MTVPANYGTEYSKVGIVRELYHRCTHGPQTYELCALLLIVIKLILPEALVWGSWYGDGVLYSVPLLDLCVTVIYQDNFFKKNTIPMTISFSLCHHYMLRRYMNQKSS